MITDDALNFYEMLTIECPLLDMVERRLREKGDTTLLQELVKFQKDAALETAWVICGGKDTPEGHEVDKLWEHHQPITSASYTVFNRVAEALKGHELEGAFAAIVAQIPKFTDGSGPAINMTREI